MRKNKPIEIPMPPFFGPQLPGRPSRLPALFSVIVIFAALLAVAWLSLPKQPMPQSDAKIELFLDSPAPFFENESAVVRAFSSCGSFSLFLDGAKIAEGGPHAEASMAPMAGKHILLAKNSQCGVSYPFLVVRRECSGNQSAPCVAGGCEGAKSCIGGIYSECVLPLRACVPGESTGCSLDYCRFGYRKCNACGTGFGPCLASENASANGSCGNSSNCS